jgi:hypothetical protein
VPADDDDATDVDTYVRQHDRVSGDRAGRSDGAARRLTADAARAGHLMDYDEALRRRKDAKRKLEALLEKQVLQEERRRKAAPFVGATVLGLLVLFVIVAWGFHPMPPGPAPLQPIPSTTHTTPPPGDCWNGDDCHGSPRTTTPGPYPPTTPMPPQTYDPCPIPGRGSSCVLTPGVAPDDAWCPGGYYAVTCPGDPPWVLGCKLNPTPDNCGTPGWTMPPIITITPTPGPTVPGVPGSRQGQAI